MMSDNFDLRRLLQREHLLNNTVYIYPSYLKGICLKSFTDFFTFTKDNSVLAARQDLLYVDYDTHYSKTPDVDVPLEKFCRQLDALPYRVAVIYHPFWYNFALEQAVFAELKKRNIVICLVVDDVCYMQWMLSFSAIRNEVLLLGQADFLILASEKLHTHLLDYDTSIASIPYAVLGVHDFATTFVCQHSVYNSNVIFFGNAERADAVIRCVADVPVHVFAAKCDASECDHVFLHAYLPDDRLFVKLSHLGGYNLCWINEPIESGYYQYNAPYKLTNGIIAGLPPIVWSQAQYADFVKEKQIGLVLDSLDEIGHAVKAVTSLQYENMHQNCLQEADRLRGGYYSRAVFAKFLDYLVASGIML